MYEIIFTVLMAILGLEFGSFLNVCIYRIPRGIFFQKSRSYCPQCETQLKWYDNIPLFSFIFLKGRCRYCKEKISIRYPIVEALNCILWLVSAIIFGISAYSVIVCVFVSVLIVVSFVDWDLKEIPYSAMITIFILGLLTLGLSFMDNSRVIPDNVKLTWWHYLVGVGVISVPFLLIGIFTGGGIGGGDVGLMAAAGLFLGFKNTIVAALIGVVIAGAVGVVLMTKYGKTKKSEMALGPYLAIGCIISCFLGNELLSLVGLS